VTETESNCMHMVTFLGIWTWRSNRGRSLLG